MKQKLIEWQGEIGKPIIKIGAFNTPFSIFFKIKQVNRKSEEI